MLIQRSYACSQLLRGSFANQILCLHHRQSHEPRKPCGHMTEEWLLMRCSCGHAFGSKSGGAARCTRCDSSSSKRVGAFGDGFELFEAVSAANLPKEVARQIALLAHSPERLPKQPKRSSPASTRDLLSAMRSATDSSGHLTIPSLANELQGLDISEPTALHKIGRASCRERV